MISEVAKPQMERPRHWDVIFSGDSKIRGLKLFGVLFCFPGTMEKNLLV